VYPPLFTIVARLASVSHSGRSRAVRAMVAGSGGDEWQRIRRAPPIAAESHDAAVAHCDYRAAAALGIRTPQFTGRFHTGVLIPWRSRRRFGASARVLRN